MLLELFRLLLLLEVDIEEVKEEEEDCLVEEELEGLQFDFDCLIFAKQPVKLDAHIYLKLIIEMLLIWCKL